MPDKHIVRCKHIRPHQHNAHLLKRLSVNQNRGAVFFALALYKLVRNRVIAIKAQVYNRPFRMAVNYAYML